MIEVKEETNGSFTISWDEKDPVESIMNDWTENDFIQAIKNRLKELEKNDSK